MRTDLLELLRNAERLRALADTELLDSAAEPLFDKYTRLAASILQCPTSLISLVDDHRQFFKSAVGLGEPWATLRETPLSHSFCKYAVASEKPLIVEDAALDPLVRDNLAVSELGVKAYAGMPLTAAGQTIGVLCVADSSPRRWTTHQLDALRVLAAAVTAEIELIATRGELSERTSLLSALTESALDAIVSADASGKIVFCNQATERMFSMEREQLIGAAITCIMPQRFRAAHIDGIARVESGGEPHVMGRVVQLAGLRSNGEEFPLELSLSRWHGRTGSFYTAVMRDVTERSRTERALRETQEQLRQTVDSAPIGMALVSLEGRWLRVNDAICAIVGYTREDLLRTDFQTITHPEDLHADLDRVHQLLAGTITSYRMEKRYLHQDGRTVWAQLSVSLVRDLDGRPLFFISQIEDVSGRRLAEAEARMFFEHSIDMLTIIEAGSGRLGRVNAAWTQTLGWSAEALTSGRAMELIHPDDVAATGAEAVRIAQGEGTPGFRNRYRDKDGRYHWLEWASYRPDDTRFFCVARDVTERIELEEQIRNASLVDELTGLKNRRGFMLLGEQQLSVAARYGRSLVLLFADLNGLKRVNDELGHAEGDRMIVAMAEVMRKSFRQSDILARLGGDEFVLLAEGSSSFAEIATQKLEDALALFNAAGSPQYPLSASVGAAVYEAPHSATLSQLIAAADARMYDAKRKYQSQ